MEVRTWESEPWEWDKGVNAAQPPGPPLPTSGPHPARPPTPTPAHNYLAFPAEGRRGREKGRGVPVCCCPRSPLRAPSLPDRKPAPIPSQLQLCLPPPPPPQAHGVTLPWAAGRAQRLRPGSPLWPPKARLIPGRPQPTGPSLLVPGPGPSFSHASHGRGCL